MEEGSNRDDALGGRMKLISSKVDSKIYFHKDAVLEYMDLKHIIGDLTEEKARMEQEVHKRLATAPPELLTPVREQLAAAKDELAATRAKLDAANEELAVTREKLGAANEELAATREQLEAEKKEVAPTKEQLIEAVRHQDEQQSASAAALESVECQPSMSLTLCELSENTWSRDELDVLRGMLIKEFLQLDSGGRILGVKEMGRLNRKPFDEACASKLSPTEAKKTASKLYATWENLLKNPNWKPFKTVVVGDDHHKSILLGKDIDVDDDKLQELKRAWGEGAHNAVVRALVEMSEYNCLDDRTITYELWNYKAGRKATTIECVEYMSDQAKQLSVARRRKTRR
ncbi:hypothetical protein PR202_ga12099 [Eleusine coracana subsp. coracana]|uniref:Factor of DNA methylation 1-5/IDN2 domain-containing protein n=1 Tax=Eleusine coracana subsp. coracana TaxID=191504 RepID=A0AAV5CB74_ELECO|nr:hypothetical protein PR202_ga12099 [Eleusine coracana subsp. coracana]